MLVSRQVFLFSMLLADTMGMGGAILQFFGALMILVVRSVVIACGRNSSSSALPLPGARAWRPTTRGG
jgi:hypothetical protein